MQINWRICAKDSDYVACPETPTVTKNPNVYEVVLQFYTCEGTVIQAKESYRNTPKLQLWKSETNRDIKKS